MKKNSDVSKDRAESLAKLILAIPFITFALFEWLMFSQIKPVIQASHPEASLWRFDLLGFLVIFGIWFTVRKLIYKILVTH
jgi:hypothetical protein